jgi:hypothetical protein
VCACATPTALIQAGIPHTILRGAFLLRYSCQVSRAKKVDIVPVHPYLFVTTVRQFKNYGMDVQRDAPKTYASVPTRASLRASYTYTAAMVKSDLAKRKYENSKRKKDSLILQKLL